MRELSEREDIAPEVRALALERSHELDDLLVNMPSAPARKQAPEQPAQ